eukprot:TRINITY_DN43174_c0_g1_i1.p1 TRINITY_DN43174_c0_g1~~TRINITY_DN43174_c0_g1_i1.p1  ORF type:complete len:1024 (+),score=119.70 TRINITY_DN43174_c0_g1_i1:162-3233(+)
MASLRRPFAREKCMIVAFICCILLLCLVNALVGFTLFFVLLFFFRRGLSKEEDTTGTPMSSKPLLDVSDLHPSTASAASDVGSSAENTDDKDERKQHRQSLFKCELIMQQLKRGKCRSSLNETHRCLVIYKNHWLDGTVLHYAVWRSSKSDLMLYLSMVFQNMDARGRGQIDRAEPFNCNDDIADAVRLVLQNRADVHAEAHCDNMHIDALHLAAGLGVVQAMSRLIVAVDQAKRVDYVNRPVLRSVNTGALQPDGSSLHEAAWHGHLDVMEWLLQRSADPRVCNVDGMTPLHLLAIIGGSEAKLKGVVEMLVDKNAQVDAVTNAISGDLSIRQTTPFEISGLTGSRYPRSLMYLLTKSWHTVRTGTPDPEASFIDDLLMLRSRRDAEALSEFLRQNEECHHHVRLDAQKTDAPNKLANLVYTAPLAAVNVLTVLTVAPEVPDPMRSPITTRAILEGWFESTPMKCTYQSDTVQVQNLGWPSWFVWQGLKKSWQFEFLPDAYTTTYRGHEKMYDVDMKVLLLPNILDMDIMWALSRTWTFYNRIFLTLPVQGLITCLWTNIIAYVEILDMCFKVVDLSVLACWAFLNKTGKEDESRLRSILQPLCWAVLAACFLRETVQLLKWISRYYYKSVTWKRYDRQRHAASRMYWPQWKATLWSFRSFFGGTRAPWEFVLLILPLGAFLSQAKQGDIFDIEQLTLTQTLHAYNVIARCIFIFVNLQTCPGIGRKIVAIIRTISAGNVLQVLIIIIALFLCSTVAYQSLMPTARFGYINMYFFRGTILGDGDGLDNMGMSPSGANHHAVMTMMIAAGTVVFYVVFLNLAIAVFEREYTKAMGNAMTTFHQLRAATIVKNMMQLSCSKPSARVQNRILPKICNWALITGCLLVGIVLPIVWKTNASPMFSAILIATGQFQWKMTLIRSEWLPPDMSKDHFLWICHRDDFDDSMAHEDDAEIDLNDIWNLERRMADFEDEASDKLDNVIEMLRSQGTEHQSEQMTPPPVSSSFKLKLRAPTFIAQSLPPRAS